MKVLTKEEEAAHYKWVLFLFFFLFHCDVDYISRL